MSKTAALEKAKEALEAVLADVHDLDMYLANSSTRKKQAYDLVHEALAAIKKELP